MANNQKQNNEVQTAQEGLNLDEKVTVKSIAGWLVGFARISDGHGDVNITPFGSIRLSRNEIIAQAQNGNKLFVGIDGKGGHATLYIEDAPTRRELEFDSNDGVHRQEILTDDVIKHMFSLKQTAFESEFNKHVKTRAEENAVIQAISKYGFNDYSKIRYVENKTGFRLE